MGTFAGILQRDGVKIPDAKKEEFQRRVEELFQAGGMMEMELVQLCGRQTRVLKKASIHDYGMDFYYNYFEDDCWENAGLNFKQGRVWSNKIGWSEFHHVIVAAYVLESLYLDGPAIATVNGEFITSYVYTGWINDLFQENYMPKKNVPWFLFEALHDEGDSELDRHDWKELTEEAGRPIDYYEIRAVLDGTASLDAEFDQLIQKDKKEDGTFNFYDYAKLLKKEVRMYHEECKQSRKEQLSLVMKMLHDCFGQEDMSLGIAKEYADNHLKKICFFAFMADAPVYTVKVVAEIYKVDFWKLWKQVKDVAERKYYKEGTENAQETSARVPSVSTEDFFGITSDDRILFWGYDKNIRFSEELENWFADLKEQYDCILNEEMDVENPLYWILDLMVYADENYYCVYAFADFFEETMEHLNDKRFLAFWKIYDRMLHDPRMKEAGDVIFVPDEPEYEHIGVHDSGRQPRRRLKWNWEIMLKEEKNNKARVTLRRYMALMENQGLRKKVFGF